MSETEDIWVKEYFLKSKKNIATFFIKLKIKAVFCWPKLIFYLAFYWSIPNKMADI